MFKILTYPNKLLFEKSEDIIFDNIDFNLNELINSMFNIMYNHNGVGLSAIQIGIKKNIFIIDINNVKKIFINPKIISFSGTNYHKEGCLSFPHLILNIKRYTYIKTMYHNIYGEKKIIESRDMVSRCIQHEIDHLQGITYIDRVSKLKKNIIEKKYCALLKKQKKYKK